MMILEDIKNELPKNAMISDISYEGSEIILYTQNKKFFTDSTDMIKSIVNKVKKRIEVRADPAIIADEEKTVEIIHETVPKEAGIKDIYFEPEFAKVVIHAEKPGLVIGKNGETLLAIKEKTFWTPDIKRAPVIDSDIIRSVRKMLHKEAGYRKKFLNRLGEKIYSPGKEVEWIRATALGAYREVGRSCTLLQTPNTKVLLDCGLSVSMLSSKPFPYLDAPEFHIQDLDAVILSHAHLDHCLPPQMPVRMANGSLKPIGEIEDGDEVLSMNFDTGKIEIGKCIGRTSTTGHNIIKQIKTPFRTIEASPNHRFFKVNNLEVVEAEAQDLRIGDLLPYAVLQEEKIKTDISLETDIEYDKRRRNFVTLPNVITEDLASLLGYMQGDGHRASEFSIRITDSDTSLLEFYKNLVHGIFNFNAAIRHHSDQTKNAWILEINNIKIIRFLERNFPDFLAKTLQRNIPQKILHSNRKIKAAYLRGLMDAAKFVGFNSIQKNEKLSLLANKTSFLEKDIVPITSSDLKSIVMQARLLGRIHNSPKFTSKNLSLRDWLHRKYSSYCTRKTASKLLKLLENRLCELKQMQENFTHDSMKQIRQNLSLSLYSLAYETGIAYHVIERRELGIMDAIQRQVFNVLQEKLAGAINATQQNIEKIRKILAVEVLWEPITEIRTLENPYKELIDIEVLPHRNFIAEGIVVHNCGVVPFLFEWGYRGPLYCTRPTRDLSVLLQLDYLQICQRENKKALYTSKGIEEAVKHCVPLEYGEVTDIAPDMRLTFQNAGHLLGSATTHIHIGDGLYNVLYSGDMKYQRTKLFERTSTDYARAETVIIEATYGTDGSTMPTHREGEIELVRQVKKVIERGGRVIIPAFAVGRSQDIIAILAETDIQVPIYLDGMLWDATAIHTAYPEFMSRSIQNLILHKGNNPFVDPRLKGIGSQKEREQVFETNDPCVVLATSGMLMGGPAVEYLQRFAAKENNMLLFVGYQAEGTMGRRIQKGWKSVQLENGRTIELNLEIATVSGLGGHSEQNELLQFINDLRAKPKKILTNHGDNSACVDLARRIHKTFKIESMAPKNLETVRLK